MTPNIGSLSFLLAARVIFIYTRFPVWADAAFAPYVGYGFVQYGIVERGALAVAIKVYGAVRAYAEMLCRFNRIYICAEEQELPAVL